MLSLTGMIVLLSLDNDSGRFRAHARTFLTYGLAGALLFELARMKKIHIDGHGITLIESTATRDSLLNSAMTALAKIRLPKKTNHIISYLSHHMRNLKKSALQEIVDNGYVREEEKRFLGLFPYKCYPLSNYYEKEKMVERVRSTLIKENRTPDPQVAAIISILGSLGVLRHYFSSEERKTLREIFKQVSKGSYFNLENQGLETLFADINRAIRAAISAASG